MLDKIETSNTKAGQSIVSDFTKLNPKYTSKFTLHTTTELRQKLQDIPESLWLCSTLTPDPDGSSPREGFVKAAMGEAEHDTNGEKSGLSNKLVSTEGSTGGT
jgi:hypothetical protein